MLVDEFDFAGDAVGAAGGVHNGANCGCDPATTADDATHVFTVHRYVEANRFVAVDGGLDRDLVRVVNDGGAQVMQYRVCLGGQIAHAETLSAAAASAAASAALA